MSHLVLELRPGETIVVNGATIRFRSKCRVELVSRARFLFGKQIIELHEAASAMELLYYRLQTAYAGPVEDRAEAALQACDLLDKLKSESTVVVVGVLVDIQAAFEAEDFYRALKLLRTVIKQQNLVGCQEGLMR